MRQRPSCPQGPLLPPPHSTAAATCLPTSGGAQSRSVPASAARAQRGGCWCVGSQAGRSSPSWHRCPASRSLTSPARAASTPRVSCQACRRRLQPCTAQGGVGAAPAGHADAALCSGPNCSHPPPWAALRARCRPSVHWPTWKAAPAPSPVLPPACLPADLDLILRTKGVQNIVLAGITTDGARGWGFSALT